MEFSRELRADVLSGDITLTFTDGEHARMDYTVDGATQAKSITRQVFGTLLPLCR